MPRMKLGGNTEPRSSFASMLGSLGSYAETDTEAPATEAAAELEPTTENTVTETTTYGIDTAAENREAFESLEAKLKITPTNQEEEPEHEEEHPEPISETGENHEEETEPTYEEEAIFNQPTEEPSIQEEAQPIEDSNEDAYHEEQEDEMTLPSEEDTPAGEQAAPVTTDLTPLIQKGIELYQIISAMNEEERESINILLGYQPNTELPSLIAGIISNSDEAKGLLQTVSELSTVDATDPSDALIEYSLRLIEYDVTTLQNLAVTFGRTDLASSDARTITKALAKVLVQASVPVLQVASRIASTLS